MAKFIYCSECGHKSTLFIKAVKGYGIVKHIDPHECHEEPIELDMSPQEIPYDGSREFVEKLNELPSAPGVSTMDLRDRRVEESVKTSAPSQVLDHMKSMKDAGLTSSPEGGIMKDPEGG